MRLSWQSQDSERRAALLLTEMWACLEMQEDRLVYKNADLFDGLAPVLSEHIRFPAHWYTGEVSGFTRRAALDAKKGGAETPKGFLDHLERLSRPLIEANFQPYRIWTKISAAGIGPRSRVVIKIGEGSVVLSKLLPKSLQISEYFISGVGRVNPNEPKGGVYAIASGKFRSDLQAGDGLTEMISDLLCVINFVYLGRRVVHRSGKAKPKSVIIMGDNQYLFRKSVDINRDSIWYNPEFRADFWESARFSERDFIISLNAAREMIKRIRSHVFGGRIMAAMRMLTEGWTSHDERHRILRSWTAFELLLSRSSKRMDNYEAIVKRASFLARRPEIFEMRLRHAASVRNRCVHENQTGVDAESVATTLDNFFVAMVNVLIFSDTSFSSHEEFIDVLDLCRDPEVLQKQIDIRRKAIDLLKS